MIYLLDTCVVSELVARRPQPEVLAWLAQIDEGRFFLSAITFGEIARGIHKLPQSGRKEQLADWLEEELLPRFKGRVLSLDTPVMLTWGRLVADLESKGRPLPAVDSLIAALALHHDLELVTRNEKDFEGVGVTIVNPWN